MIARDEIVAARDRIAPYVRRTPVAEVDGAALGLPHPVVLKLELFQHTGSFKPRGAFNNLLTRESLLVDPVTGECMDPSNGCVPANVFGENNISDAAADFIRVRPIRTSSVLDQSIIAASLVGNMFELPAGEIGFALGVEARD